MSSKSSIYLILYAGVAAIITLLFLTGQLSGFVTASGMPASESDASTLLALICRDDVLGFLALVSTGLVCCAFGASRNGILVLGTIASFIVLTAHQDLPMVRYMTLGGVLFAIGIYGMVTSRNAIRMLMSIELMINAANINFVAFTRAVDPADLRGQLFAIFVLAVAAAEAAVGLAIVLAIYRNMSTVDMDKFNLLKW